MIRLLLCVAAATALMPSAAIAQAGSASAQYVPLEGPNTRAKPSPGPNTETLRSRNIAQPARPYPSCAAARSVTATPLKRGEPGYGRHLDRDGNGRACE